MLLLRINWLAAPFALSWRELRFLALAFALCFAPTATFAQTIHRDWAKYPAIVQVAAAPEIFAIGDVHADCERLEKLLVAARIIDRLPATPDKPQWIAGTAIVVFTGDLIDKGPNALGAIAL